MAASREIISAQFRELARTATAHEWVRAMERLLSDRLGGGGYEKFEPDARERLCCAWKDLKDVASAMDGEVAP